MPDIDPSNSYGTPEGPETPAVAHVTEPLIDPDGREHLKPKHAGATTRKVKTDCMPPLLYDSFVIRTGFIPDPDQS